MKRLKAEIKELQAEMKTLKDNPSKMMKVQKQAMETNTKYMMHSLKPTLFTFIPIILIFGWLNANMAYFPLIEGEEFSVLAQFDEGVDGFIEIDVPEGLRLLSDTRQEILDDQAKWVLQGDAGDYSLSYTYDNKEFYHPLIITNGERRYADPDLDERELGLDKSGLDKIMVSNDKVRPLQGIPLIQSIPWIGGFGWLGTYILFSIGFSIGLRRLLKVY